MRIEKIESWRERVPLTRPYAIASADISDVVHLFFVRVVAAGGLEGVGSGSPVEHITGETPDACAAALEGGRLDELVGRDSRHLGGLCRMARGLLGETPAARAALDMALHDLFARELDVPLVDLFGRVHEALPTSITLGIRSTDETIAEAREYVGRGFRCLKAKIGRAVDEDIERLTCLREEVGRDVRIRVDVNEGYGVEETLRFAEVVEPLDIELVEQPLPRSRLRELRALPPELRQVLALDESLHAEEDAVDLVAAPVAGHIHVIKLMKCGGLTSARTITEIAETKGREVMWGCMDESVASISAALHLAYATPSTRYVDLDGSFDLSRDPASGGFNVVDGCLRIDDGPGLGVRLHS